MSNERTDEFLKWRGLLDQPDARPDQVLDDREATWQKLAERLGERRRNRLSGYRIAAACLLFALIIPAARLLQDRHNDAGVLRLRQPVRRLSPVSAAAVQPSQAPAVAAGASAASAAAAPGATTAATTPAALPIPRTRSRIRLPLLANIRLSPTPIMAAPPDSASQSPLPRPSQETGRPLPGMMPVLGAKELKVVHQNEIRGGNTPSPAVGATGSDRLINILFRPDRQQPSSAPPAAAEDPALLKIKLSPSN
jgi:hypothetical protein